MPQKAEKWKLSKAAAADLEEIWFYTRDHWDEKKANEYTGAIRDVILQLASKQRQGRKLGGVTKDYLHHSSGSHNIFFREEKTRIVVVRIPHERMDFKRHL